MAISQFPIAGSPIAGSNQVITYQSTGGVLIGGSAHEQDSGIYTSTGGVLIGGTSAVSKVQTAYHSTGGVLIGGTSSNLLSFAYSSTGGMKTGGDASKRYIAALATGQLLFDSYWDDAGQLLSVHQMDTGQFWTATNDWTITNSAGSLANGWSYAVSSAGQNNYSVSVTVTLQSSDNQAGIAFRFLNSSNTWLATLDIQNQALKVYILGAATLTLQGFTLLTINAGQPYLLEVFAEGSTIIAQVGDYSVKVTSTTLQTATNVGTVVDDSPDTSFNTFDTTNPVNDIWTAGGVKIGGSSPVSYVPQYTSTGGVIVGGAAGPLFGYQSTGGVKIGGTGRAVNVEISTGGVLIGGSAVVKHVQGYQSTGGVKIGGMVLFQYIAGYTSTGGVLVGGAAGVMDSHDSYAGNALTVFLSGATVNRGSQTDPDLSLGGFKSNTEAQRVGFLEAVAIPNIDVISCSHQTGTGSLIAVGSDNVSFAASGGATGTKVPLQVGFPMVVSDGDNPSQWVKVERTTSAPLTGFSTIEFEDQFNNVFGMDNEATGESDTYRAVMFSNDSTSVVSAIYIFVNPLSEPATCLFGLGSSGNGQIIGGADAFAAWSYSGFANVSTASGTLKEIVYYTSRTSDVLTVAARGLLGTSATMGAKFDVITQVPPIRVALNYCQPFIGGSIQTIANESTAPTGRTWSLATTATTGINVGVMNPNEQFGVWIHRNLPTGIVAVPQFGSAIGIQFTTNGVTYTDSCQGLFRVSDSSLARYELAIGVDQPPNIAAPAETFTSLPYTTTTTFDDDTFYLVTNERNAENLASEGSDAYQLIVSSGSQMNPPPSAPASSTIVATSTGAFTIGAVYYFLSDPEAYEADEFHVYVRFDGTNPNPAIDTPIVVQPSGDNLGVRMMTYTTAIQTIPTTAKAIVRTFRSLDSVESTNANIISATSLETAFVPSVLRGYYRPVAQQV